MAQVHGKQIKDTTITQAKLNLASPVNASDATTKAYVDALLQGLDVKASVRLATTTTDGDLDLATGGLLTIDSVVTVAGDRVLVKNQTTASQNGIYVVVDGGAWTRATDADTDAEVTSGMFMFVEEGTENGDYGYVLTTNNPIVVGTTALTFVKFSTIGAIEAGSFIDKTGNTISVKVDINGGLYDTGSGELGVRTDSASTSPTIRVNSGTLKANVPVTVNKGLTANVTTADFDQATNATIANTPAGDSYVTVLVNGVVQAVGDGSKFYDCYFSGDGGTSARTFANISAGDTLHWVGSVAGFELSASDVIDFIYNYTANS